MKKYYIEIIDEENCVVRYMFNGEERKSLVNYPASSPVHEFVKLVHKRMTEDISKLVEIEGYRLPRIVRTDEFEIANGNSRS